MRISTKGAANLSLGAQHWSNDPRYGNGHGPEKMDRAANTVVEFAGENAPKELKLAASTIWLAVQQAHATSLIRAISDRHGAVRPYLESEDGWKMQFIQDESAGISKPPINLGLEFTRRVFDDSSSHIGSVSSRRGDSRPQPWYSDAYIWVTPLARSQGIATLVLERLASNTVGDLRMPFEIDPSNAAATILVERFTQPQDAVMA